MVLESVIGAEVARQMDRVVAEKVFRCSSEDAIPPYSTDMSSAAMVMTHMAAQGFAWKLGHVEKDDRRLCTAELSGRSAFETGSAESIELAICLAALKVVDRMELY